MLAPTEPTTPSPPAFRIPLETLYEILRYFRPVSPNNCYFNLYLDLVSASFVCTQWHQVASTMFPAELFEGLLEFSTGGCTFNNLNRLKDLILESRCLGLATFEQMRGVQLVFWSLFNEKAKSEELFMSQQINRIFTVLGTNLTELGLDFMNISRSEPCLFPILKSLGPHCRHVSRLTLCSWRAPPSQVHAIFPLLAWLKPNLRSITLQHVYPPSELVSALALCPHITMFTISAGNSYSSDIIDLVSLAYLCPNLDTLHVRLDELNTLLLLLVRVLPRCHRLHTLNILNNGLNPGSVINLSVIENSFHSLRHVTVAGNASLAQWFLELLFHPAGTSLEHLRLPNCGRLWAFRDPQSRVSAQGLKTLELNGCDGIETEVVEAVVWDCLGLERLVLPKQLEEENKVVGLLVERGFKMKIVEEALVWEKAVGEGCRRREKI